mgnify:CR=1 FL=1
MKKESPFWSSISLLIGIVIAILALIRGRMRLPLLLAVFALWLLWWLLTQALPLWRNNRAYRAKEAQLREQTAAANGGGQLADALLCHVNYRITAMLHAAYPNAPLGVAGGQALPLCGGGRHGPYPRLWYSGF